MNKKEAADYLGISTRALERYVSLARIGVRYEKGKTGDQAVFDDGELRQFKAEIDKRKAPRAGVVVDTIESPEAEPRQLARLSDVAPLALIERMTAALEALKPDSSHALAVPIADKVMLTLPEAAALTSLSRGHLRAAIREGKLKARIIGRGWRVKRDDLNAYVKKL